MAKIAEAFVEIRAKTEQLAAGLQQAQAQTQASAARMAASFNSVQRSVSRLATTIRTLGGVFAVLNAPSFIARQLDEAIKIGGLLRTEFQALGAALKGDFQRAGKFLEDAAERSKKILGEELFNNFVSHFGHLFGVSAADSARLTNEARNPEDLRRITLAEEFKRRQQQSSDAVRLERARDVGKLRELEVERDLRIEEAERLAAEARRGGLDTRTREIVQQWLIQMVEIAERIFERERKALIGGPAGTSDTARGIVSQIQTATGAFAVGQNNPVVAQTRATKEAVEEQTAAMLGQLPGLIRNAFGDLAGIGGDQTDGAFLT